MISSWTFFLLAGGEVIRRQHHQPSGSYLSGVYLLVGRTQLASPSEGGCHSAKHLEDIAEYPLGGTRARPLWFSPAPSLSLPPVPSLIWACSLELREGLGGWRKPVSYNQETGDMPRSPTGPCWVSASPVVCLRFSGLKDYRKEAAFSASSLAPLIQGWPRAVNPIHSGPDR